MIIRRLGVMSVAKISAIIAAVVGLLAGFLFFLVSLAGGAAGAMSENDPGMAWISGLGAMAIVVLPILYGVFGFIGGAIQAFVYNLAAKFVGGIKIETE